VCLDFLPFLFCCQNQISVFFGNIGLLSLSIATGIINFLAAAPDIIPFVFSIFSICFSIAHLVFDFCSDFWCRGDGSAAKGGGGGGRLEEKSEAMHAKLWEEIFS